MVRRSQNVIVYLVISRICGLITDIWRPRQLYVYIDTEFLEYKFGTPITYKQITTTHNCITSSFINTQIRLIIDGENYNIVSKIQL